MNIYMIWDKKGTDYLQPPLVRKTAEVCMRELSNVMTDNDVIFAKCPEDFELHCLGAFVVDDEHANPIMPNAYPQKICDMEDLVRTPD